MDYKGYSVFLIQPNQQNPIAAGFKKIYDLLKYMGLSVLFGQRKEGAIRKSWMFTCFGRSSIYELEQFFESRKGACGNFWAPSWQQNIHITAAFLLNATSITIENINYINTWAVNEVTGRYLIFMWPDGHTFLTKIIGWPTTTTLTIADAIDRGCTLAELRTLRVMFLYHGRFDGDEIEWTYDTPDVAETELIFVTDGVKVIV